MRHALFLSFCLLLFLPQAVCSASLAGKITWIYDGDTIRVEKIGKVRLIGIDAPERNDSDRDQHYTRQGIPQKRLREISAEALRYLIDNVKGENVTLETDRQVKDKYGRTLAYVYLADGRMLNRILIEKGLAAVYRRFSFSRKKDFLQIEKTARKNRVGLWSQAN